jgi:hypothetical protein
MNFFCLKSRLLLVLVGVVCVCTVRAQAQGANLSGAQDTVRLSPFGPSAFSSVFSMNQNVQTFNDTMSKYGYGRIAATAIGADAGYTVKFNENMIGFLGLFFAYNFPATSETYTSWLWKAGFGYDYGYILLKNDVFRLYPMLGFSMYGQLLTIQERVTTTPAMLNPAQFREPWRINMTSWGFYYHVGVGADVRWENAYNRVYEFEQGKFQVDMRIGLHLNYNLGAFLAGAAPWSANGAGVSGLSAIAPQGLSLKVVLIQEFVKLK